MLHTIILSVTELFELDLKMYWILRCKTDLAVSTLIKGKVFQAVIPRGFVILPV